MRFFNNHFFRHQLTKIAGKLANCKILWVKNLLIKFFCKVYSINVAEAVHSEIANYSSFNDFFTRQLKPTARAIAQEANAIISPVDGCVNQIGIIQEQLLIQTKGIAYLLENLLKDKEQALNYEQGCFSVLYLSPQDYHRVHLPETGRLLKTCYIPGKLFSVNPKEVARIPGLFCQNERLICYFEGVKFPFVVIFVGALLVAGIRTVWHGLYKEAIVVEQDFSHENFSFSRGEEIGSFEFGSTIILLLPKTKSIWKNVPQVGETIQLGQIIFRQIP